MKRMTKRLRVLIGLLVLATSAVHAQQTRAPFANLDEQVRTQAGGWNGDKSKLSAVFAAERQRLGNEFEATFAPFKLEGKLEKVSGVLIYRFVR